jgi:hypothetical protein
MSMYNPERGPTPLQEMRQNWADEVAALKEQIVEAIRIIEQFQYCLEEGAVADSTLLNDALAFVAEHTDLTQPSPQSGG